MLSDERFDDRERLTRTRRTDNPCATEGVCNIHPAFAELALVVVTHGYIHRILVLHLFLILFKALVLEVEAVFHQASLQILGDIIQGRMYEERSEDGRYHIYPDIEPYSIESGRHIPPIDPYRQYDQCQSCSQWDKNHLLGIELDMLLVTCAYAGNKDQQQGNELTVYEVSVLVDGKL